MSASLVVWSCVFFFLFFSFRERDKSEVYLLVFPILHLFVGSEGLVIWRRLLPSHLVCNGQLGLARDILVAFYIAGVGDLVCESYSKTLFSRLYFRVVYV